MENTFNVRLSFKGEGELTFTLPIVGQITIWAGRDIYLKGATQRIVEILRQYRSMQLDHKLNGDATGCYRIIEVGNIDRIPKNAYRPVAVPKTEHIAALKAEMMKANQIANFDAEVIAESEKEEVVVEAGQPDAEELQKREDEKTKKTDEEIVDSSKNTKKDLEGEKIENEEDTKNNTKNTKSDNSVRELAHTDSADKVIELPKGVANKTVTVGNLKGKKIGELNARELRKVLRYAKNESEKKAAQKALDIKFPQN